ncbi:MAG TPA: type II toxin-antitoxin system VapC family toxin [Vicinamibacterales bacterium]|nr:type II toxin-antitoxin system VapC family toxin [Vicinamibacterales bacterium]
MAVLLDTHAFLWWVTDDRRLTKRARRTIGGTPCLLSVASCWEMAIKVSLGKLTVPGPVDRFVQEQLEVNGFNLLPIALEHTGRVAALPFHHRDPFDRLLAAQALTEDLSLVSADPVFRRYGVTRLW